MKVYIGVVGADHWNAVLTVVDCLEIRNLCYCDCTSSLAGRQESVIRAIMEDGVVAWTQTIRMPVDLFGV